MPTPYSKVVAFPAVATGSNVYLELPAPRRGIINRFVVKQTAGILSGFAYDVYNKDVSAPLADQELYEVMPQQTVAALAAASVLHDVAYGYDNADGSPTNPVRRLWVKINILGTGTKDISIAYTIIPPL